MPFELSDRRFGAPIDIFPWVDDRPQVVLSKIHNGMGLLDDGRLAIGEGILYSWDGLPFEWSRSGGDQGHQDRRRDACGLPPLQDELLGPTDLSAFDMRCMSGGKILLFDPDCNQINVAGQVQPFNYCQSLAVDALRHRAYGHTLGDCHFFVVDLDAATVRDHGRISTFAFHNLCIMPDGVVYGAWIDYDNEESLRIVRFNPARGHLERLWESYLPQAGPRVQGNRGVDQWLVHSDGAVYLGMAGNGTLYRFDADRLNTEKVGRIGSGGRVTTIDQDQRGRVIFTAGFPIMHVGRFDPTSEAIEDFGPVTDRYEQIYFHGSVYYDGTLWLAETDSGVASLWEVKLPD